MFCNKPGPTVPGPVVATSTVLAKQLLPLELAGAVDDAKAMSLVSPAAVGTASSCSQPSQGQDHALLPVVCSLLGPGCAATQPIPTRESLGFTSAALAGAFLGSVFPSRLLQPAASRMPGCLTCP